MKKKAGLTQVLEVGAGLLIAAAAAAAWHYWHIDGTVSVLIAFGGIGMAAHGVGYDY